MQNILEETKFLMKKYNITANKSLGQNFLINDLVIQKIIEASEINKEDLIIEIGPGLGTLTSKLLEEAGKVIGIELDERMIKILSERFYLYDNFEIINEDVLKINLNELIKNEKGKFKNVKIVANLPYYITTPIIMKLLEEKLDIQSITVMVQKEVADRITEIPGGKNTGAITYSVFYYSKPQKICFVPKDYFLPVPKVDSEVIKLEIRNNLEVKLNDENLFFKIIKASFMQRRKTLLNGLINGGIVENKERGKILLKKLNLDENVRGEKLSIEQFARFSKRNKKINLQNL